MKQIKLRFFGLTLISLLFVSSVTNNAALAFKGVTIPTLPVDEFSNQKYVPNEVIVKFKRSKIDLKANFSLTTAVRKMIFNWNSGLRTKDMLKTGNLVVLGFPNGQRIEDIMSRLKTDPNVEYVEPNYIRYPLAIDTNDTLRANLWGLDNTGQTVTLSNGSTKTGVADADIDMPEAWAVSTGTTEVLVAVIDTGVAYNHPDLINRMWDGTNCKDENGADLGGCNHGYEYGLLGSDNDPLPTDNEHGTHVAGTIGASYNNNKGISGVGPNIKIMALKIGFGDNWSVTNVAKAVDFARFNGAKVINGSYGGPSFSQTEYDAMERFRLSGGIFVAAAGNEATNNDISHHYPSDYDFNNLISVAATDQGDTLASFSNYGATSIDIAAPGVNIYSTVDEYATINYGFSGITNGNLPPVWTSDLGSSWGVYTSGSPPSSYLYADAYQPYREGINSVVTSDTFSLATYTNATFTLQTYCDTENTDPALGGDYLAFELSSDGTNFDEITRLNTFSLDAMGATPGYFYNYTYIVDPAYFTGNFKYRLHWVTDTDGDTGSPGTGCVLNTFKLSTFTDGTEESYDYLNGTSMAAPHVAGLVGYLWSVKPSASYSEIVSAVLDNGDPIPGLSTKTVTGMRINAYNSVMSLGVTVSGGPSVTGLSNDSTPAKSKTFTWSSDNPGTDQYRYSFDQAVGSTISGAYGAGTSAAYSTGDGTFYIHVQAQDVGGSEGSVSTASFILDNTGPASTVSNSSANVFTLSFGETLFDNGASALSPGADLSSRFVSTSEIGISTAYYLSETVSVGVTGTSVAGSKVSLSSGEANNFFDSLTNAGGPLDVIYDGSQWWVNPTSLNVAVTSFSDLISTGQISVGGAGATSASSLTVNNNFNLTIGSTGTNGSIGITTGTVITELTDQLFDANSITGSIIDPTTVSNLEAGYVAESAIQWGIPGTTLKFSQPVTVSIYLGAAFNGITLNVYRSPSLSVGWTSTGLSSSTCLVASGYCTFSATEASYFVAAQSAAATSTPTPTPTSAPGSTPTPTPTSAPGSTPTPTPTASPTPTGTLTPTSTPTGTLTPTSTATPTPTSGSSNNSGSSNPSPELNQPPRCTDQSPLSAPDLFKINTTKGSAKIVFTPVNENISGYAVMYGLKKGDERYAAIFTTINSNQGEQSYTINKLKPGTTYYFKVTAINGCTSGPWSEWIPAKADRKKTVNKYKTVIKNKVKTLVNQFK